MRVLITAGPTWVKVDAVRILTNIFTGRTGLYLAKELKKRGHLITLFLNPHCFEGKIKKMRVIPFKYYEDLRKKIIKELRRAKYDAIIHTAAVSDYKLKRAYKGKLASGRKELNLRLTPTVKIIKTMRKLAKDALLIQFKLEEKSEQLIARAYQSLKKYKSDFVVANSLRDLRLGYKAYLIDKDRQIEVISSKKSLVNVLDRAIRSRRTG